MKIATTTKLLAAAALLSAPMIAQAQGAAAREGALAAYTSGAAYAGFAEGRFGRLALGERADFVVLSGNPLDSSAAQIRELKVLETWVGGRKVYDAVRPVEDENAPVAEESAPGR